MITIYHQARCFETQHLNANEVHKTNFFFSKARLLRANTTQNRMKFFKISIFQSMNNPIQQKKMNLLKCNRNRRIRYNTFSVAV